MSSAESPWVGGVKPRNTKHEKDVLCLDISVSKEEKADFKLNNKKT